MLYTQSCTAILIRQTLLWLNGRWAVLFGIIALALLAFYVAVNMLPTSPRLLTEGYDEHIVIKKGGIYSGNWESRNSEVPAVEVRTSEPVVIEHSSIRGAGVLIRSTAQNADITVRHTTGYGITPTQWINHEKPRRFLATEAFRNIVVENCYMEGTAGIYLGRRYEGNGSTSQTIKIRFNSARNIDGRVFGGKAIAQFVQFNFKNPIQHAEIAWNQIINEPDHSLVEDNINIYNSRGTEASPILVHNNYIQGAYPLPATETQYSGGGILTDSPAEDSTETTAHVRIFDNQLIGLGNYCIGIAGGNHIEVYSNRAIVSGMIDDERAFTCWTSGIWAKDFYETGTTYKNSFYNNDLAVVGQGGEWRNEIMEGIEASASTINNSVPQSRPTRALEQQEYSIWLNKLSRNKIKIGPVAASTSSTKNINPNVESN